MSWHQSHLLRKGRVSEQGRAYVVTTVTEGRRHLFADREIGTLVADEIRLAPVETLAWVLMPDHLHWLFVLQDEDLATEVRSLKSRSAHAVNRKMGSSGAVWQKNYYDHALRKDEDLATVAQYVISNPLRAGLVERVEDYPLWGSVWR